MEIREGRKKIKGGEKRNKERKEKIGFREEKDKIFWQFRLSCAAQATRTRRARGRVTCAFKVIDAVASVTRSRDTFCATGARAASRSHNSLFKILFCQILGDTIAWGMRSHEWALERNDADA